MKHTTPDIVDMPPEMREKLLAYRKEHANDPLGDVADRVIFEDDKVRIWDMKLEPGQFSALHRHDHSYYLQVANKRSTLRSIQRKISGLSYPKR